MKKYMKKNPLLKNIIFTFLVITLIMLLINCSSEESVEVTNIPNEKQNNDYKGVNMSNESSNLPFEMVDQNKSFTAVLNTNKGSMTFELFTSESPMTVSNFISLSNAGFYDNVIFHRIIQGFMVQGGDPDGSGRGGPGYKFADELTNTQPPLSRRYLRGTLAMANSGPNTNGSQFFIVHADASLPSNYTIFGQLTESLDILDVIASTPVTVGESGEASSPTEKIIIQSIKIIEN
jgi:cyclophilin family peptidyl-prolyl cis-trans isomerase